MSLNIKVLGCNGLCGSCYENAIRARVPSKAYDIEKILATLVREIDKIPQGVRYQYGSPCIHGGEPLLMEVRDLERLLAVSYEGFGRSSIQTNGLLLTEEHIFLFKKYGTHVGFSLDGDTAELNFGRWNARELPQSDIMEGTFLCCKNMKLCNANDIPISVITILRKYNATAEQLPKLKAFLWRLKTEYNCTSVRTNEGIVFDEARFPHEQLTPQELGAAFIYLSEICYADPTLGWSPYRDVVDLLLGYKDQTCVFGECDPWKTASETTIDENGSIGSCLKSGGSVDGLSMLAADTTSRERYNALKQIPQENGGCKDCKYWNVCKGGCPGAAIGNDWRNRTRFCEGWKMLFEHVEKKISGLLPNVNVSTALPDSLMDPAVSLANLSPEGSSWKKDKTVNLKSFIETRRKRTENCYGDRHGDQPHGDHTDTGKVTKCV